MGFLTAQRNKWRARRDAHSARHSEDQAFELAEVSYEYRGGSLGITLQRAKSKWVDEIGPAQVVWHKETRLGLTFHERADGSIVIKELLESERQPALCIGQGLLAVNGTPIAGMELVAVMGMLRSSSSPCELVFTPPPSPIIVSEVTSSDAVIGGVSSGHVLVSANDTSMVGCSLQEAGIAIEGATDVSPVILHFAPLHRVLHGTTILPGHSSTNRTNLRNTLCMTAVIGALAV